MAHPVGPTPARAHGRGFRRPLHRNGPDVLFVNKSPEQVDMKYLAEESPVFRTYYEDRQEKRPWDHRYYVSVDQRWAFIAMMRVIEPYRMPLRGETVKPILAIAKQFKMDRLIGHCLNFLDAGRYSDVHVPTVDLVQLAMRYERQALKWRACERLFSEEVVAKRQTVHDDVVAKEYFRKILPVRSERELKERCAPLLGDMKTCEWLLNKVITRPGSETRRKMLCNDNCAFDTDGVCVVCEYQAPGARNGWEVLGEERPRQEMCNGDCENFEMFQEPCWKCTHPTDQRDPREVECGNACAYFDLAGHCRKCKQKRIQALTAVPLEYVLKRRILCGNGCKNFDINGRCAHCEVQGPWK